MEKIISEGKCVFCTKTFKKAGISRHLNTHLTEMAAESKSKATAIHLSITSGPYFLNLLIGGTLTLSDLDDYLQAIWVGCCGHLSSFTKKGVVYDNDWDDFGSDIGEKKNQSLKKALKKGDILRYEYDFGSTTELDIKVLDTYAMPVIGGIQLLSRNEPLHIVCHVCKKKPAVEMCTIHGWNEASTFCETCAKKHEKVCEDFADYSAMPLVNSPRTGVCAYDGGMIDTERDGIWKK